MTGILYTLTKLDKKTRKNMELLNKVYVSSEKGFLVITSILLLFGRNYFVVTHGP